MIEILLAFMINTGEVETIPSISVSELVTQSRVIWWGGGEKLLIQLLLVSHVLQPATCLLSPGMVGVCKIGKVKNRSQNWNRGINISSSIKLLL